jgi:Ca2+/Na+ antiporter
MGADTAALLIGTAPSLAMGMTYVAMANSISDVMANAVVAEKNMQTIATAATVVVSALIIKAGASS